MVTITASVGEGRKKNPKDILAVEGLLRKAGMLPVIGPVNDIALHTAIRRFQAALGNTPDGRVDPGGGTLNALNAMPGPFKITSIKPDRIDRGGYKIAAGPFVLHEPYKVLLGFSPLLNDCVDITGRPKNDLLDTGRFDTLLAIIHRLAKWGGNAQVKLYVQLGDKTLSESAAATLPCPVQPHNGTLLPLDEIENGPKLKYLGDSAKGPFYGRMLEYHALGFYLFKYGGVLETNLDKRGFDCITYCGAVLGASTSHMAEAGDMAKSLGATSVEFEYEEPPKPPAKGAKAPPAPAMPTKKKVTLDSAEPAIVKQFFESDRPDRYLLYSGGHVVLVDNKVVHEFSYSKGGYSQTDVTTWLEPYKQSKLTVKSVD